MIYKKIVLGLMFSGLFISAIATEKKVVSQVSKVTVYLNGAQIERTVATSVPAGKSTLRVEDLPAGIDANSIQASGKGDLTILAVNYKTTDVNKERKPEKALMLEDSIDQVQYRMSLNQNVISALAEEKKMIMENNKVDYTKLGFAVEDLEDLSDYFRNRISEILNLTTEKQVANQELAKQKSKLQQELNEVLQKWRRLNGQILIDVYAKQPVNAAFELAYYVNNAGWFPVYNIKSDGIDKPVTLNYNAKVYQNTGADWNEVLLTLSTTNPVTNNNKPVLNPWRLDFITGVPDNGYKYQTQGIRIMNEAKAGADVSFDAESAPAGTAANFTKVNIQATSVSFDIKLPYNIPSDGEQHLVNIQNMELEADYEYYTAPKLSTSAFLLAKVKNWEDKNLLPGQANIYLNNTFVGKSNINPNNTDEKLELSFGVDKTVVVTRKRIKDYCSTTLLGNNKKETIGYEVQVRNTKKDPIEIVVQDQIPTTGNEDISISLEEDSKGDLNKDTGILTWRKDIQPSSTTKLEVKFEVKYPKDKTINL